MTSVFSSTKLASSSLCLYRSCRNGFPFLSFQISRASSYSGVSGSTLIAEPARTRFAPSPTGYLHLGSLRTALFNYLLAKATGGQFLLRIEDTDQKRTIADSEARLCEDLKWAGLQWDEGPDIGGPYGPYRQSQRTELYQEHAQKLVQSGVAYRCFCTAERLQKLALHQHRSSMSSGYDRACTHLSREESDERESKGEAHIIRLKAPGKSHEFNDLVYGKVQMRQHSKAKEPKQQGYDDSVLIKSDGFPTYHIANVVDDHLMKITHVIRGTEWMPSTHKHHVMYKALGWEAPKFAHVGLLVNSDGSKLSKRESDTTLGGNVAAIRDEQGTLPQALINFVALLGWSHTRRSDVMNIQELIDNFSMNFTRGDTAVNLDKLWFLQRHHAAIAVQTNETASIDTLVQFIKKALVARPDWVLIKTNWEDNILLGRDGDAYIYEILCSDSKSYTTGKDFTERNLYFFTPPSENALTEKLPALRELFLKSSLGKVISITDLADVLPPSFISPSATTIRHVATTANTEATGDASQLSREFSVPNINAWMRSAAAEKVAKMELADEEGGAMLRSLNKLLHVYMRWALVGWNSGPSWALTMVLLGPGETRRRLERAVEVLKSQP